jgi:hypothetical protein
MAARQGQRGGDACLMSKATLKTEPSQCVFPFSKAPA